MIPLQKPWMRLRSLLRRRALEREMADELRFHLEMQEAANRAAGMSPDEAHFAARRQFGHLDGVKEAMRDLRGWIWFEQLGKDVAFAANSLARSRVFLLAAVPTLAFGIGLCTTIFSVINPVLFRPLPFPAPNRLVFLNESTRLQGVAALAMSYADYLDWRKRNRTFSDLGLFLKAGFTLQDADQPMRLPGGVVTASLFRVLGVPPALGRTFLETDEKPDAPPVVVLSHEFWAGHFGSDPDVLGRSLVLDNRRYAVVGVMPRAFSVPESSSLWVPLIVADPAATRGSHAFSGVGRLKPGVTLENARDDLATICQAIAREFPAANTGVTANVVPLRDQFLGRDNLPLMSWLVLAAVGFVLAVAAANVASLFLARSLVRRKEFAIRAAFGGSRGRAVRQLLIESTMVAATAGVLGFALSLAGVPLILALVPVEIPPWIQFGVDLRVCSFAAGISLVTCAVSGLAPALRLSATTVQEGLCEASRESTVSRSHRRLRSSLVVTEVALASLLLCGSGLMIRSVQNLQRIDPGFESANLAVFSLNLPVARYGAPAKCTVFYRTLLAKLHAVPGVTGAAAVSHLPLGEGNYITSFYVTGRAAPPVGRDPVGNLRGVTPGYFAAMGIPLLEGRDFTSADTAASTNVVIVDRAMVRRYFPDSDPLGQHLQWSREASAPKLEIVGVVGNVKHYGLQEVDATTQPGVYLPHAQAAFNSMTVVVRMDPWDVNGLTAGVRRILRDLDGTLPWSPPEPMEHIVRRSFWTQRLVTKLFSLFSLLALALTALGIAGTVAYSVAQRTHEIGVRMALGASEADAVNLVMKQGIALAAGGLLLGLLASTGLTRVLTSQLYAVNPLEPAAWAASACLLGAVAVLASYLPARRAARVDPLTALHDE